MESSTEDIQKHVKTYLMVGATLFVFTIVTVLVRTVPFFDFGVPGVDAPDIAFGLVIATFKSSLVMLIFMHLNHERGLIYKVLLFTVAFAISLMGLTLFAQSNPIQPHADVVDEQHVVDFTAESAGAKPAQAAHAEAHH
jgi:caa(3)-type oxidase subunit IV